MRRKAWSHLSRHLLIPGPEVQLLPPKFKIILCDDLDAPRPPLHVSNPEPSRLFIDSLVASVSYQDWRYTSTIMHGVSTLFNVGIQPSTSYPMGRIVLATHPIGVFSLAEFENTPIQILSTSEAVHFVSRLNRPLITPVGMLMPLSQSDHPRSSAATNAHF